MKEEGITMKKKLYNLMMLAVVVALTLTACANKPAIISSTTTSASAATSSVIAEGKLKPAQGSNLSFQVRGIVEAVNVKIGDPVKKGDVLARLSNAPQAEAQLASANLELLNAQQASDTLNRNSGANLATA